MLALEMVQVSLKLALLIVLVIGGILIYCASLSADPPPFWQGHHSEVSGISG